MSEDPCRRCGYKPEPYDKRHGIEDCIEHLREKLDELEKSNKQFMEMVDKVLKANGLVIQQAMAVVKSAKKKSRSKKW
jgi:prefoldin subunit 5